MATVFIASRKMKLTCPAGDGGVEVDDYRSEMIGEFMACHAACFNKALLPASPSTEEREEMAKALDSVVPICPDCSFLKECNRENLNEACRVNLAIDKAKALILAPPVKVTREWVAKTLKAFMVKDDPVGTWQARTTVKGDYPYMLCLEDVLDLYREKGIEVKP